MIEGNHDQEEGTPGRGMSRMTEVEQKLKIERERPNHLAAAAQEPIRAA